MASRRGVKGVKAAKAVDLGDVEGLLEKARRIRKKYKALKKRYDASREGAAAPAAEIRRLADDLKKAIDEAHSAPLGLRPQAARGAPAIASPPAAAPAPTTPVVVPAARITVAPAPRTESVSRSPAVELGRMLFGFLRSRLLAARQGSGR